MKGTSDLFLCLDAPDRICFLGLLFSDPIWRLACVSEIDSDACNRSENSRLEEYTQTNLSWILLGENNPENPKNNQSEILAVINPVI
jgi:hypothetical protein